MDDAVLEDRDGVLLSIEVTASAKSSLFPAGFNEWRKAIGCRVTAPAVDGKANKAVIGLISTTASVPTASVSIVAGLTSSQKEVRIAGVTKARISELLFSEAERT
ncbi:DUF167 domain-containing protein [Methanoregula sp.]|uniref:DUF167 domain-containing protein n=1 Tax=Methanoregula sp. TaxID=2052170 RepID=UPI002D80A138|nr:DUF167 domain-containing protein [Methanoregula sp.]